MSRGVLLLLVLLLVMSTALAVPLPRVSVSAGAPGIEPFARSVPTTTANQSNQSGSSSASSAIPPVVCPLPPVNTTLGIFSCKQMLDLTEIFVILFGITITLYVYKDADQAELPGEAVDVPITGHEELEMRRRKDAEERALAELEEKEDE